MSLAICPFMRRHRQHDVEIPKARIGVLTIARNALRGNLSHNVVHLKQTNRQSQSFLIHQADWIECTAA